MVLWRLYGRLDRFACLLFIQFVGVPLAFPHISNLHGVKNVFFGTLNHREFRPLQVDAVSLLVVSDKVDFYALFL